MKQGNFNMALSDAEKTVQLNSTWPKGYSRKSTALFHLKRFDDSLIACKKAIELDPSNLQYKSNLDEILDAIETQKLPSGIWAQIPLPRLESSDIDWDTTKDVYEWFINKGSAGLAPISFGKELDKLTSDDIIKIIKQSGEILRSRSPLIIYLHKLQFVKDISSFIDAGAKAVILPVTLFMSKSSIDEEDILSNMEKALNGCNKKYALGISDTKEHQIHASLLAKIVNLKFFSFYVDYSDQLSKKREKYEAKGGSNPCFKIYNASIMTLLDSLQLGYDGYIGDASSFYPELLSWVYNNIKIKDSQQQVHMCQRFFTLTDLVLKSNYPYNVEMFWKIHAEEFGEKIKLSQIETQSSQSIVIEENVLRLSHLSESIKYVWGSLKEEKNKDRSVIL